MHHQVVWLCVVRCGHNWGHVHAPVRLDSPSPLEPLDGKRARRWMADGKPRLALPSLPHPACRTRCDSCTDWPRSRHRRSTSAVEEREAAQLAREEKDPETPADTCGYLRVSTTRTPGAGECALPTHTLPPHHRNCPHPLRPQRHPPCVRHSCGLCGGSSGAYPCSSLNVPHMGADGCSYTASLPSQCGNHLSAEFTRRLWVCLRCLCDGRRGAFDANRPAGLKGGIHTESASKVESANTGERYGWEVCSF